MYSTQINCCDCNRFDRSTIIEKNGKAICVCQLKSIYKQFNSNCEDDKNDNAVSYQVIKCPDNFMEKYEIDQLKDEINRLKVENENWKETIKRHDRDLEYYKNIIISIGKIFEESFMQGVGYITKEAMCNEVYELVFNYKKRTIDYYNFMLGEK